MENFDKLALNRDNEPRRIERAQAVADLEEEDGSSRP